MHEDMIPGPPALRPVPDQPANIKIIFTAAPPPSITPIIHIFFTRINNNYLGICHRTFFRASLLVLSQLVREESPCNTSFIWLKPYICADQYGIFCFSGSQLPTRLSPPPTQIHPPIKKNTFCSEYILPAQPGSTVELPPFCSFHFNQNERVWRIFNDTLISHNCMTIFVILV